MSKNSRTMERFIEFKFQGNPNLFFIEVSKNILKLQCYSADKGGRGLIFGSAATRFLVFRVSIPPGGMDVSLLCLLCR
jgi:hypothetical protein